MAIPSSRIGSLWNEWKGILIFIAVMMLFRSAIADWNQVPTGSMKPTILEGDRVVVNKLAYDLKLPFTTWHLAKWDSPARGEIVTFYSPKDGKLLIKRVIGVPGDVIALRNNQLFVNNRASEYAKLDSAYMAPLSEDQRQQHDFYVEKIGEIEHPVMVIPSAPTQYNSFGPVTVPEEQYLMLGDNRDHSGDSRLIGFIDRDSITGRAHTVAFSVDYEDYYLPRLNRFILKLP
jgi:signal peptidase I